MTDGLPPLPLRPVRGVHVGAGQPFPFPLIHQLSGSFGGPCAWPCGPALAVWRGCAGVHLGGLEARVWHNSVTHISFPLLCSPPACMLFDLLVEFSFNKTL